MNEYRGREQARVKHAFLREYLTTLAIKLGWYDSTINYVDGFSGPWKSATEELSDTSPYIALEQLSLAYTNLLASGKNPRFRCLFIEKNPRAHAQLRRLASRFPKIEVHTKLGSFDKLIHEVRSFVSTGGPAPFGFVFIDPTGWKGYGLNSLAPLLQIKRIELLINFMTSHIIRFVGTDQARMASFSEVFGRKDFDREWEGLYGRDREDAIVNTYRLSLRDAGKFRFTGSSVVLNPHSDRSHYHLVFATRNLVGLRVYREVEARSLRSQGDSRQPQLDLFSTDALSGNYIPQLRARYHRHALKRLDELLMQPATLPYSALAGELMGYPMVAESHVKAWLEHHRRAQRIRYIIPAHARVPSLKRPDQVVINPTIRPVPPPV